jgi:hypothetical protein
VKSAEGVEKVLVGGTGVPDHEVLVGRKAEFELEILGIVDPNVVEET